MSAVFMDTVGFLALWNKSDQWHAGAAEAFANINQRETTLVTTLFILLDCGNAAARSTLRNEVDRVRQQFELAETLIWPTAEDWSDAWAAYRRREAASAGIVDQVSFVVMRRLGITEVFTNDTHFRATGFKTLF